MELLLALALIGGWSPQTAELPPLPPALAGDAALQQATRLLDHGQGDLAARKKAASLLLAGLSSAEGPQQAEFLLTREGAEVFPEGIDLDTPWRRLASSWPQAGEYVRTIILRPGGVDLNHLRGALAAAGHLGLADPEVVAAIGADLDRVPLAERARASLYAITRHEFPDTDAFSKWWETAHSRTRADWLIEAVDDSVQRETGIWRERLAKEPSAALLAVRSPVPEIRLLGYQAMATLPAPPADAKDHPEADTLREIFYTEHRAALRAMLVRLIPQYLNGQDAMALLGQALVSEIPAEREEAARVLPRIRPLEVARAGLLAQLERVYLPTDPDPSATPAFRAALFDGLREVTANGLASSPDQAERLDAVLELAVGKETDTSVRADLYAALGNLQRPAFFSILLPLAREETRDPADRSAALSALTRIVIGAKLDPAPLLETLHPLLGNGSPDLRYRAIRCLQQLGTPSSAPWLAARLKAETEEWLVPEILKALAGMGEVRDTDQLVPLLAFQPTPKLEKEYLSAVRAAIGTQDLAKLGVALQVFEARQAWSLAFRLLDGYPRDQFEGEDRAGLERRYAFVLSSWLLQEGLGNGRTARAADAATRLAALHEAQPEELRWPLLLARIQTLRGKAPEALAAWQRAAAIGFPAAERWADTLEAVAAARAAKDPAAAHAFLAAAGDPPQELAEEVAALREEFPAPAPAPTPAAEQEETEPRVPPKSATPSQDTPQPVEQPTPKPKAPPKEGPKEDPPQDP